MIGTPAAIDVPLQMDQDGIIRVGGTRVTLKVVIGAHRRGDTPEQIVEGFDVLKLEDVYTVIAYYLSHREEIDSYIRQADEEAEQRRQELAANNPRAAAFDAKVRTLTQEKHQQDRYPFASP